MRPDLDGIQRHCRVLTLNQSIHTNWTKCGIPVLNHTFIHSLSLIRQDIRTIYIKQDG
jgi:hypothetical protein